MMRRYLPLSAFVTISTELSFSEIALSGIPVPLHLARAKLIRSAPASLPNCTAKAYISSSSALLISVMVNVREESFAVLVRGNRDRNQVVLPDNVKGFAGFGVRSTLGPLCGLKPQSGSGTVQRIGQALVLTTQQALVESSVLLECFLATRSGYGARVGI